MKNNTFDSPIENYVPHRKPMLLLSKLIKASEDGIEANYTIDHKCIFLKEDDTIEPVALMEILAQCFAAGNGVTNPSRFGYLVSMRSMKVYDQASIGETVLAKVTLAARIGDIMVIDGKLYKDGACILEGQYKIFAPSEDLNANTSNNG